MGVCVCTHARVYVVERVERSGDGEGLARGDERVGTVC